VAKNPPDCNGVGNPISVLTGVKYQHETDYAHLTGLEFSRYYSSDSSHEGNDGLGDFEIGQNWRHSYSARVVRSVGNRYIGKDGNGLPIIGETATLLTRKGQRLEFYFDASNQNWSSDSDINGRLTGILEVDGSGHLQAIPGEYVMANGRRLKFDSQGRLSAIVTVQGQVTTLHYSLTNGALDRVSDAYGRSLTFSYNADQRVVAMTDQIGNQFRYSYDGNGNLAHVSMPDDTPGRGGSNPFGEDNPYRSYHYSADAALHQLVGITDENRERYATWVYDGNGRAISSSHGSPGSGIDRVTLDYTHSADATNPYVLQTNPLGKQARYRFEKYYGVMKVTGVDGLASSNCMADTAGRTYYPDFGWLQTSTDRKGNVTHYSYYTDATRYGLERKRTEAQGSPLERVVESDWYPSGLIKSRKLVGVSETSYTYTTGNRLASRTVRDLTTFTSPYSSYGKSRRWGFSYTYHDSARQRVATLRVDAPGGTGADEIYAYSDSGLLLSRRNALGQETQYYDHNAMGQAGRILDENGVETRLSYTARGWLQTQTVENGGEDSITHYRYDAVGQLVAVTLPNGVEQHYEYDDAHRLTAIVDSNSNRISFGMDKAGNIQIENIYDDSGNLLRSVARSFDELNRVLSSTSPANSTRSQYYGYDLNDNPDTTRLAGKPFVTRIHDALDRVKAVGHADGGSSSYSYDEQGHLASVTDQRGLVTHYQFDGLGNLMKLVSPDTGTTLYQSYDSAGNLLKKTDAKGNAVNYQYDALNRLISRSYASHPELDVAYSYDDTGLGGYPLGRLGGIFDSSGYQVYQYNALGLMSTRITVVNDQPYFWSYSYDPAGNLVSIRYPSGRNVDYQRNALGQIASVTTTGFLQLREWRQADTGARCCLCLASHPFFRWRCAV
jgi:YD repeat-containing protein